MDDIERPVGPLTDAPAFGSNVVAATLRALDAPYVALTPGASFRSLHDSLVNCRATSAHACSSVCTRSMRSPLRRGLPR
jgi:hypothetical protein